MAKKDTKKSKKSKKAPPPSDSSSDSSSDDSSSEEEVVEKKVVETKKQEESSDDASSSDDDSSSEEEEKPAKKATKKAAKKEESSDDESSDDSDSDSDEKPAAKKAAKKEESSDDSDDSDDSDSDSDSDDEDEEEEKKTKSDKKRKRGDDAEEQDEAVNGAEEPLEKKLRAIAGNQAPADAAPAAPKEGETLTVFCGNLSWNTDENMLGEFFAAAGEVTSARVVYDRDTGRARGFGYVEFVDAASVPKAVAMAGGMLDGRDIRVEPSYPREKRQNNNRNGGGGNFGSREPGEPSATVFVGNMSWNSTEDSLYEFFSQYGSVNSIRIITDRETGRPKGYGYAEFGSVEEAKAAVANSGADVDGRAIRLDFAQPRKPRDSFGGGGGGGYGGGRSGGYGGGRGGGRRGGYGGGRGGGYGGGRGGGGRRGGYGGGRGGGGYGGGRGGGDSFSAKRKGGIVSGSDGGAGKLTFD